MSQLSYMKYRSIQRQTGALRDIQGQTSHYLQDRGILVGEYRGYMGINIPGFFENLVIIEVP